MGIRREPVDLRSAINHAVAPMWFLCAHGSDHVHGALMKCPVCASTDVRIRIGNGLNDGFFITRQNRGMEILRTDGEGGLVQEDASTRPGVTEVSVPMRCCAGGHGFLLEICQREGEPAVLCVLMDDDAYNALDPAARQKWQPRLPAGMEGAD